MGGAQALLDIPFNLADCFEESLSDEYKTFTHMLRIIEEQMPALIRPVVKSCATPIPCAKAPYG
jgi:hypothetical protein